jgi:pseudouridylate synthase / pseudouridine kinase
VAGSLASDTICDYTPLSANPSLTGPVSYTSNPATIGQSPGGVGSNVAHAAHYAGASVILASVVADDIAGRSLLSSLAKVGMSTDAVLTLPSDEDTRTAQYIAINTTTKDLHIAMADMNILTHSLLESSEYWQDIFAKHHPRWLVLDANWSPRILSTILTAARSASASASAKVAFEPVSNEKGARLFHKSTKAVAWSDVFPNHKFNLSTPNIFELEAMYTSAREAGLFESPEWWDVINHMNLSASGSRDLLVRVLGAELVEKGVPQMMLQLLPYVPNLVVKLGAKGCLLACLVGKEDERLSSPEALKYILSRSEDEIGPNPVGGVYMRLFPPAEVVREGDAVSVNGVGDTMLGVLMAGLLSGDGERRLEEVIPIAQKAAVMTLKSKEAVSGEVRGVRRFFEAA